MLHTRMMQGSPVAVSQRSVEHLSARRLDSNHFLLACAVILRNAETYLKERGMESTAIMGFGFAIERKRPFCALLFTIRVAPKTVPFAETKASTDHVRAAILGPAGFSGIDDTQKTEFVKMVSKNKTRVQTGKKERESEKWEARLLNRYLFPRHPAHRAQAWLSE
ncbi:hypothetical protein FPV67DRAFT_1764063 [Lyophyllum atratum]|nr:hypothetical protein FPV67DRAFT_1764063 [Lyophyllum atratum]